MKRMHLTAVLLLGLLIAALAPAATAKPVPGGPAEKNAQTTEIQILALNDFHGQLEPGNPVDSSGFRIGSLTGGACVAPACVPAGGVAYLATHVRNLRAENPNTLFVSAGDLIGATPLLSALFHDEPSIEAFNLMDLDYNGVGNHEFDEGVDELLRMQYGSQLGGDGCHPDDGCGDETPFHGAEFDFLAANVAYKETGETIFEPYAIHHFDGVKVGIIGMTLEGTPTIVEPGGIASVNFLDEAETVNALVPELKRQGVETIIVLLHEGGSVAASGNGAGNVGTINSCTNPTGALPPIVDAMDDEVDVVVTGHTNWAVNCVIDGKVVTGAASQGRLITKIDLTLSRATKDVVGPILVDNRIVTRDVTPAPDLLALIDHYNVFAEPIASVVVGQTTGPITRAQDESGESQLGNLIADAQLESSQEAGAGGQIAFMNPGGIRADIGSGGDLTHGEAFAVQPFSNILVTMDLTGAQIETLLEQQFMNALATPPTARTVVLGPSNGFTYTWKASGPIGDKVDPATIMLTGSPIVATTVDRVTVNSFLATGGDIFPVLNEGTNRTFGADDLVALEAYFADHSPVSPPALDRITRIP